MNRRQVDQAERREQLRAQCALQRQRLRDDLSALGAELKPVDRGLSMIRRIRISPALLAGGAALALGLGSRRAMGGVGRAFLVINSLRRVRQIVQSLRSNDGEAPPQDRPRVRRVRPSPAPMPPPSAGSPPIDLNDL